VLRRNCLEFNQVENSAKHEFRKRETKNKNKRFAEPFVKMPFTVCVKDGSDYVRIYSVYFKVPIMSKIFFRLFNSALHLMNFCEKIFPLG